MTNFACQSSGFNKPIDQKEGELQADEEWSMVDGQCHFYVANHRGDTVQVLDSGGVVELDLRYDAFGDPVSSI